MKNEVILNDEIKSELNELGKLKVGTEEWTVYRAWWFINHSYSHIK